MSAIMKLSGNIFKIILIISTLLVLYFFVFDVRYSCTLFENKLGCYDGNLEMRLDWFGVDNSRDYLKKLYDEGFLNQGQCHTLGHKVGQNAAVSGTGMIEAMEEKGSFCGWAFFHGVMEGLFGEGAGHSKISVEEVHKICRETNFENIIEKFNCFHALGHGFYALDYNIDNSFVRCELAEDDSKKGFCYDGVFMAMTFPKEGPQSKIKEIEPLALCEDMDGNRKSYCYWRLVPIKIFIKELELPSSEYILEISEKVPDNYKSIFWNGFGRELDSRFASDSKTINSACNWGGGEYKLSCVIGAAMHMIYYDKGKIERGKELCRSVPDRENSEACIDSIETKIYPG